MDVGANTGVFPLIVHGDPSLSCMAIEANPLPYQILNKKVKSLNLSEQIDVLNMGVFNQRKELELKVPHDNSYSGIATFGTDLKEVNRYMNNTPVQDNYKTINIQCDTLDNILEQRHHSKKIDAIKIDTEGAEFFVLQGALGILSEYRPLLMFEFHEQHTVKFNYKPEDIISFC